MKEHICNSAAELAWQLADTIVQNLHDAINLRGHAVLAVSGGKSPIALFEALRVLPLEWQRVTVLLVDERCVPHDHAESNTALVRRHLLQDAAAAATFVPFFDTLPDTLDEPALIRLVDAANRRLATQPWPMDMAVLGMGDDGHTASLFPGAPGLNQALYSSGPVAWVRPATAPHARLTLTLPALLATRELALAISGASKLAVFQQARLGADESLPVSLILNQHQTPVSIWMA
ncbi:6-phosphogluconolactonase [Hydrogenophaga sp.]|uniref:6-phosphogluconolactonase n=1 Tax=Hydrogenophaga sp. TaxID=1904254 RepID=UPI00272FC068|nr:6-phosphogluconolactonase [Hydrogenophaga sp.]MDP1781436.1 6-phosphogluconolactonase [Hydrogenophaga sp.]MDP2075178.1 6-phosphogluconolactonase [Hydrogenophaga sp.]MDP3107464.1 6-phosphogluconolactonase [Hydrogenophaga sp.]MDZ4280119.1 6-phosphogluconolactonase [Hydrogenophaga sp.]MDZ4397678.1 6-phosphogluconolactonase [Hydrogenophaga sp.]